jgi:hypothetical protein
MRVFKEGEDIEDSARYESEKHISQTIKVRENNMDA